MPGSYSESRAVRDTIMPNGLIYTQVVGELFSGFFRKEGSKIFSYNTTSDTEFLEYDFSLKAGDTLRVQIFGADTILTTVSSVGTTTIFGQNRNYMTFFRDDLSSTGDGGDMIVDGFGFVQYFGEVLAYGLTGAIINGIQYGKILQVENPDKNIPIDFRLLQNYPNPFNPATTINFSIPVSARVTLKIFDVLGREVKTLVDKEMNPGNYSVHWNAGNFASGIYLYRLKADNYMQTRKLVLLK